jgi:hypothetical protein
VTLISVSPRSAASSVALRLDNSLGSQIEGHSADFSSAVIWAISRLVGMTRHFPVGSPAGEHRPFPQSYL